MEKKGLHYAWKVFIAICIITFVNGLGSSYAIFMTPVTKEFGCSITAFGLVYTLQTYAQVVGTPIFAAVYKKGKSRQAIAAAIIFTAIGYLGQGFAHNIYTLYVLNIIIGLSQGLLILVFGADLIGRWFAVSIATLVGLSGCLRAAGGAVFNGLGGWLIDVSGWRTTTIVFGICMLVILPAALWCHNDPEKLGWKPFGIEKAAAEQKGPAEDLGKPAGLTFKRLRKMPVFWIFVLAICLTPFCNVLYGYLNNWLQTAKGMTSTTAGFCNSALMVGGICGYIGIGRICDKNYKAGILCCMAGAVIAYPILSLSNGLGYVAYLILFFLIGVTYQPTCGIMEPTVVREAIGMKDYTVVWAFMVSALNFLGALGSTVWGVMINAFGYTATFIICAVTYAVLALVFIAVVGIAKNNWSKMPEWQPDAE
ncbi:MAG: MFS transporter [Lachnospiraceae bacterium]|nr:MFS transporter [Lachnospiraceae bacterium]